MAVVFAHVARSAIERFLRMELAGQAFALSVRHCTVERHCSVGGVDLMPAIMEAWNRTRVLRRSDRSVSSGRSSADEYDGRQS